ncbi:MAG TPA: hypothetical protein VGL72_32195 [Bryobacteraceae bacterium]|jgi:zinc transporter ZupT
MLNPVREYVFTLYERPLLRNWFYTLAFAIFVPVGFRFAVLAWRFGGDFDRFMSIIGGLAVGITAVVTLLRIWTVAPRKTVVDPPHEQHVSHVESVPSGAEIMAAVRGYSARNRQMARGARALGFPRRLPR